MKWAWLAKIPTKYKLVTASDFLHERASLAFPLYMSVVTQSLVLTFSDHVTLQELQSARHIQLQGQLLLRIRPVNLWRNDPRGVPSKPSWGPCSLQSWNCRQQSDDQTPCSWQVWRVVLENETLEEKPNNLSGNLRQQRKGESCPDIFRGRRDPQESQEREHPFSTFPAGQKTIFSSKERSSSKTEHRG